MQGEGGRDSGLGRINHFYVILWGLIPPGTTNKNRPIQASEGGLLRGVGGLLRGGV